MPLSGGQRCSPDEGGPPFIPPDGTYCPPGSEPICPGPSPQCKPVIDPIPDDCIPDPAEWDKCFKYVSQCICDTQSSMIEQTTNSCCGCQGDIYSIHQEIYEFIITTVTEINTWINNTYNELTLNIANIYTSIQETINTLNETITNVTTYESTTINEGGVCPQPIVNITVEECPECDESPPDESALCDKPNEIEYLQTQCGELLAWDIVGAGGLPVETMKNIGNFDSYWKSNLGVSLYDVGVDT